MDKRLNNGFICEKHGVGYITKCPTCEALKNSHKLSKKQAKLARQLKRKMN